MYSGNHYRLEETETGKWSVFNGNAYLGRLVAVAGDRESGPLYTIDLVGEEGQVGEPATDDWRRALEVLIDLASE